jgi:predicted Zn finger-like uncharacterized protein
MILTCPNCATRYQTDATIAAPGRNVRCAKCGQVWFQSPAEPEPEPAPEPEFEEAQPMEAAYTGAATGADADMGVMEASDHRPGQRHDHAEAHEHSHAHTIVERPGRSGFARLSGWVVLVVVVVLVIAAILTYRQMIASLWPQTASLYAAIGMKVNVVGLAFKDVSPAQTFDAGQTQLEVTGRIVNVTDHRIPVPHVRVALVDGEDREIYRWSFDSGVGTLAPGAAGGFVTRLTSPPQEAKNITVRFIEAGEQ